MSKLFKAVPVEEFKKRHKDSGEIPAKLYYGVILKGGEMSTYSCDDYCNFDPDVTHVLEEQPEGAFVEKEKLKEFTLAFEKIVNSINYKHGAMRLHCELTIDEFVEIEQALKKLINP